MGLIGLVVDDNEDIAFLTSHVLSKHKIDVQTLQHGNAAMRWLAENNPQLVLLDLQLPGTSGLEILKYIRETERFEQTTVIIFTANHNMASVAEKNGADLVLCKPTSFATLDTHIAEIIEQYSK